MSNLRRIARSCVCFLPLLALAPVPALAQPVTAAAAKAPAAAAPAAAPGPWLYRGSDVPQDKEWVLGELFNGLRYAVRKNGVPPGQVSIRILIDAGSLYESDSERGYAHLIEHLVFRESRYLGDGEAIPRWQRLGATFGSDTNAETSPTQTVFKLDLPDASIESLDESFKLLSGMITAPALSEANLKADVPIVLAEMRERGGPQMRMFDAMQRTFYQGQLLAERQPIGLEATLKAATAQSVRAFHSRWYRPERAIIVVAGDADPAILSGLVKKYFAEWKGVGKAAPSPSFGDPLAPASVAPAVPAAEAPAAETPVGGVRVLVEPDMPRGLTYGILRPWRQVSDTVVYNQGLMVDALAQAIINRRLEARARGGGSFLLAQVNQEDVSRSVDGTFVTVTPLENDWQGALRDVRAVIADALANPPTQDEIDREVAEMEVAFQVPVEQKSLRPGTQLADEIVKAVDIRETVAAPDDVLGIFRSSIPLFTPDAVLARTRTLFSGTVTRAIYVTPKAGEGDDAALQLAMTSAVKPDGSSRLATASLRFDDMPPIGKPGKLKGVVGTGLLGIEQVEFANGVKALIWPVKDEPGRVAVKVRFGGGYRSFAPGDGPYIALGEMALVGSGQGTLGQEELDRIATGRKLGYDFQIGDGAFTFSSETRPSDIADQLYLFAGKFAQPRWDKNPVLRAKAAMRIQYEAYGASPQGVLERDLRYLQRANDPRFQTPTPAEVEKATPDGFRQVWQQALNTGPIEVQVYGDFDRTAVLAALQTTFGALPKRSPLPKAMAAAGAGFPAARDKPVMLTHRGDANQAAAVISWPTGGGSAGISESRHLEVLSQLFGNRLLDAMREKMGASYAPQVYSSWPVDLTSGGTISALAQLQPGSVPVFFDTAREIAADLIARPPSADELSRVTEPLRQQVTRAATGSAFFMYQLEGATQDPARFAALRSLLNDYTQVTPQQMQALASRYLAPEKGWQLAVVPEAAAPAVPAAAR